LTDILKISYDFFFPPPSPVCLEIEREKGERVSLNAIRYGATIFVSVQMVYLFFRSPNFTQYILNDKTRFLMLSPISLLVNWLFPLKKFKVYGGRKNNLFLDFFKIMRKREREYTLTRSGTAPLLST